MADLLDHSPRPMTIAHQGLAACLAVYCAAVTRLPADETNLAIMRDILPQAHGDGVTAAALVDGARRVLAAHDGASQDWAEWQRLDSALRLAVASYYRARAAASHARIFPETQMQEATAHAAE